MMGSTLELAASSGASLRGNVTDRGSLSVNVLSGAEVKIARGTCTSLSANVSGGAFLGMEKIVCAKVEINAHSVCQTSVHADKSIKAGATSGSRIRVFCAHELDEIDVSTGGEIVFP